MESNSHLPVFLSLLITITLVTSSYAAVTATGFSASNSTDQDRPRQQMDNILAALVGAGDFGNWASFLSSADPSILPVTATIFIPDDADYSAVSSTHLSPFLLFPYHIVSQRLSFSDLRKYPINSRLPTLLPGFSLLITNNSLANFSIDGVPVTHPDLYQNAALTTHGISAPFDYTLYGNFDFRSLYGNATNATASAAAAATPQPQPRLRGPHPPGIHFLGPTSGSGSLWAGIVPKILGFSSVLTLMGVLGLMPMEVGLIAS